VSRLSYGKTRFSFKKTKKSFQELTPTARHSQVTEQRERTGEEAEDNRKLQKSRSLEIDRRSDQKAVENEIAKWWVLS